MTDEVAVEHLSRPSNPDAVKLAELGEVLELLRGAQDAIAASNDYMRLMQAYIEATEQFVVTQEGAFAGIIAENRPFCKAAWTTLVAARQDMALYEAPSRARIDGALRQPYPAPDVERVARALFENDDSWAGRWEDRSEAVRKRFCDLARAAITALTGDGMGEDKGDA